ncbi:hypothetical protein DL95DRAFT_69782 [Leptodontidium sp. 2 PMI_412]|nr:hypothetical protein DL95DRAFT_69782 [Leptodontidium sp. 2 PMI_412]
MWQWQWQGPGRGDLAGRDLGVRLVRLVSIGLAAIFQGLGLGLGPCNWRCPLLRRYEVSPHTQRWKDNAKSRSPHTRYSTEVPR